MSTTKKKHQQLGLWAFISILVIMLTGVWIPYMDFEYSLLLGWVIIFVVITIFFARIGQAVEKSAWAILIDPERNRMSLSRLQIIAWTLVVLSSFTIAVLGRTSDAYFNETKGYEVKCIGKAPCNSPLDIRIPTSLLALLGISLGSAVASPYLKKLKTDRTQEEDSNVGKPNTMATRSSSAPKMSYQNTFKETIPEVQEMRGMKEGAEYEAAESESTMGHQGVMVKNKNWKNARLADIFMGEEVSNYGHVDLAKVQNFFFSLIAIVAYVFTIGNMLVTQPLVEITALPDFSDGLVALLGLSHGGYLIDKSFTHASPSLG